ncbi:MAG: hypothetical protein IKW81_06730 [Pseudobutyrivibrio sp.]|nr:hypothetical protein [Pseudobutyrivibrio sp.]
MNCHGSKRREFIYANYEIKVVGCIKLYDGASIESDAGGPKITDRYYQFTCKHSSTGKLETIIVGHVVAREICEECGLAMPKEFNPFYEEARGGGGGGAAATRYDPMRRQLYNAIMLIITRYRLSDKSGTSPIFEILNEVTSDMTMPIEPRYVKAINTILKKFKPMGEIIQDLNAVNRVRNFNFNLLVDCLRENGETDVSNFELIRR